VAREGTGPTLRLASVRDADAPEADDAAVDWDSVVTRSPRPGPGQEEGPAPAAPSDDLAAVRAEVADLRAELRAQLEDIVAAVTAPPGPPTAGTQLDTLAGEVERLRDQVERFVAALSAPAPGSPEAELGSRMEAVIASVTRPPEDDQQLGRVLAEIERLRTAVEARTRAGTAGAGSDAHLQAAALQRLDASVEELRADLADLARQARDDRRAFVERIESFARALEARPGPEGDAAAATMTRLEAEVGDLRGQMANVAAGLDQLARTLAEDRRAVLAHNEAVVGSANQWFVRTRDELHARLDEVATAIVTLRPEPVTVAAGGDSDGEGDQAAELRADIRELQGEVAAMGASLLEIRSRFDLLLRRLAARAASRKPPATAESTPHPPRRTPPTR
jgi:chromosome segregation ATPase